MPKMPRRLIPIFADVPEVGVLPDVDEGEIYEVNAAAGGDQILQPARNGY